MATAPGYAWEIKLRTLAGQAGAAERPCIHPPCASPRLLRRAYAHCEAITAAHSRSFYWATEFLPPHKRRAIRALYAICRLSDDLVDTPDAGAEAALRDWRRKVLSPDEAREDLVLLAWADVRRCYRIPRCFIEQLLDGVAQDLRPPHLAHFDDLAAYSYGVASTVGLMSLYILGCTSDEAVAYAIRLGIALQLTNILRDIGDDCRAGRVYLPAAELTAYGLAPSDLAAGRVDDRWRAFLRFQIRRNRQLYAEARPGIGLLHHDARLAVAAAAGLYSAILDDIEAHDYDVFSRRAHVSASAKLRRLPGIWRQSRALCSATS